MARNRGLLAHSWPLPSIVLKLWPWNRCLGLALTLHANAGSEVVSLVDPWTQLQFLLWFAVSTCLEISLLIFPSASICFLLLAHALGVKCRKRLGVNALVLAWRDFLKNMWLLTESFSRLPIYICHCPVLSLDSNSLTTFELAWCHPGYQSTGHLASSSVAVKGRNPGQEFLNCSLWRGSMYFGWRKLPKIKARYRGHLFGLRGLIISHQGKGQNDRENRMKLNVINHSDR